MKKENKYYPIKDSNEKIQKNFQTNLLDFIKTDKGEQIQNGRRNIKQLQKVAQNKQIRKKFLDSIKILNSNCETWRPIENNKYFVNSDNNMVISDLSNFQSLVRLVKFLFKISSLNNFNEIIMEKEEKNNVEINEFNYILSNLTETYRILSFPFKIYQNDVGLLICTNMSIIILIAPSLI